VSAKSEGTVRGRSASRARRDSKAPKDDEDAPDSPRRSSRGQDEYYDAREEIEGILRLNSAVMEAAQRMAPESSKDLVARLEAENKALEHAYRALPPRRKDSP